MRVTARRGGSVPQAARPAEACDSVRAERITVSEPGEPAVEFESDAGIDESPVVEVAIVPQADAADNVLMARIAELVNRVYAEAEKGLWRDGADRTDAPGIAAMVHAGELAVARLDGRLVGAVRIRRLDPGLAEFGMLVASPEHRGIGIGRALVAFAKDWARQQGLSRMQLEVLAPRTWTHPVKEFLRDWYTRIGYRQTRTGRLADACPALQPQLATPCDFAVYHKNL
jgi:GNAT superfamily N-acetyltransferase